MLGTAGLPKKIPHSTPIFGLELGVFLCYEGSRFNQGTNMAG
jgi:hypothetical protein